MADFWVALEYRVSRELPDPLWCDGFQPETYDLDAERPQVRGLAWIGIGGGRQEQWDFTLLLPDGSPDWPSLLPDDRDTGWLSHDAANRTLGIDRR
ncbi:hypothetical protein BLA60_16545 [Actinophytocola xinjiangensis]|uniref:Uncharacterized protein n=1 Tax=Actinophytocola xinjiangensis TaxID=485602 RepID=A0A7Z1AZ26_9PSEU|nr:hypothetical protein [Actinophytocola xinjiangensis]OLF10069.1 hypothetical protein BLA60_16545 [Actinophytocola xinjiangensis]